MALEYMHKELMSQLLAAGATDEQIQAWEGLWQTATMNPGEPLPCPSCFLMDSICARLKPIEAPVHRAACKCEVCKTVFEYPDDN